MKKQKIIEKKKRALKGDYSKQTIQELNDKIEKNKDIKLEIQNKFIDGKGKLFMSQYFVGKAYV